MALALIRRLIKGTPLTASEHDGNLNVLEAAIAACYQQGAAVPSDVECRNNSGGGLTVGAPVYITSSSGTKPTVALADASSESTAARSLGLVITTVGNNADCVVRTHGILTGVNTATLTEGQAVWLSETTGQLTSTRPTQPAHGVFFGFCVKQAAGTAGILYVSVINGLELGELHDVLPTGATTDDALTLASDGLWKPRRSFHPASPATTTVYTASGAISLSDQTAIVNSANPVTMTLAAGSTSSQTLIIKRLGAGSVTIAANLDGANSSIVANSSTTKESIMLAWYPTLSTWLVL